MTRLIIAILLAGLTIPGSACRGARDAQASVVDSIIPRDEALRRFRAGLPEAAGLSHAAKSRDGLVRQFLVALQSRDSVTLSKLTLSRAEFAYIYYPTNPQSLPPYDLSPALMWFVLEQNSQKGLGHALEERGGRPLHAAGYECLGEPSHEGGNTVWGPCVVRRVEAPGDTVVERMFGPIIERAGQFKFVSFANKL